MPVCPKCEYEYEEGVTVCPDCGEPLVPSTEFEPAEEWVEADWTNIYETDYEYEADMIKANLESADIVTTILSQKDRNFPALGDLSPIKIMVHNEDAEAAGAIIKEILENKDQEDLSEDQTDEESEE